MSNVPCSNSRRSRDWFGIVDILPSQQFGRVEHTRELLFAGGAHQRSNSQRSERWIEPFRADIRDAVPLRIGAADARRPCEIHPKTLRRPETNTLPHDHDAQPPPDPL